MNDINSTKSKCPIYLVDFYESQNPNLVGFRNGAERLYDSTSLTVKYNDFKIPIYSKYLAMIFFCEKGDTILESEQKITLNDLKNSFLKGFENGFIDFEQNHKISANNFYSRAETYIQKIKRMYNEDKYRNKKGCKYFKFFAPEICTLENFGQAGFAYGHLVQIENLINSEKELFASILESNEIPNSTEYPKIFKDGKSQRLFETLRQQFLSGENKIAYYSFIFYSMQKDGFVICRNIDFINFLSQNYDIDIDRIDSRQYGTTQKTPYYESLKSAIFTQ